MKRKILAVLLGAVITGASVGGVVMCSNASGVKEEETESKVPFVNAVQVSTSSDDAFSYANVADVAEAVMPSIVAITNMSVQEVRSFFYGQNLQYKSESAGSGIIVGSNDTELLICTNNHVVENSSELTVTFADETSIEAQVKGTDPANDLAVVAVQLEDISDDTMDNIRIAKIGSSDDMRVGEQVVAIGNALGYGQSVTTGIVSAKNRSIAVASDDGGYGSLYGYGEEEDDVDAYEDLIQTDAAINPGNSGGALLNMNGEVIGINSAKAGRSGVEGMGYAIPVDKAMPILNDLMSRVTRSRITDGQYGYLGINGQSVSSEATFLYGIPQGVYVTYVADNSPAFDAGLKEGDIITKFDGITITSMEELQSELEYYAPEEEIEITVYTELETGRGYEETTMNVTLGDRSQLQ